MDKNSTLRILGIDPGTAITGWSIMNFTKSKHQLLAYGVIRTSSKTPMPERLKELYEELSVIIKEFEPAIAAIEDLFYFKNAKTVITVGQARGVAILACVNQKMDIYEYTPLQIKQTITGYGRADKMQIQKMLQSLLHLKELPKPDDAADAIAAAYTHGIFFETRRNAL